MLLSIVGVYGMIADYNTENTIFPTLFPEPDTRLDITKYTKPWIQKENKMSMIWFIFVAFGLMFYIAETLNLKVEHTLKEYYQIWQKKRKIQQK